MIIPGVKYSYSDLCIIPSCISNVKSRSECNVYYEDGYLPLFTSPMTSVVGLMSFKKYCDNKIHPILPRSVSIDKRLEAIKLGYWSAFSLGEFNHLFNDPQKSIKESFKVLIDIANGHMKDLFDSVKSAKSINPNLIIMIGNIANPETYEVCCRAGADYVRVGIGAGKGCITSPNSGVHYPMGSLLDEINQIREIRKKNNYSVKTKVIADGGIRGYGDIAIALALGADYVMIGSVFARMLEAEGKIIVPKFPNHDFLSEDFNYKSGKFYQKETGEELKLQREFYGMASAQGQIDISGSHTKTSEGITEILNIKYTMSSWVNNFVSYFRTSMSYTNSKSLEDFIGKPRICVRSTNTYNSINK